MGRRITDMFSMVILVGQNCNRVYSEAPTNHLQTSQMKVEFISGNFLNDFSEFYLENSVKGQNELEVQWNDERLLKCDELLTVLADNCLVACRNNRNIFTVRRKKMMMSYIIQRMPCVSVWKNENDSNTLKKSGSVLKVSGYETRS